MKKYKLLKDLPGLEAGTIIEIDDNGEIKTYSKYVVSPLTVDYLKELIKFNYTNNDWLEEIKEEPKSIYELKRGDKYYFIIYNLGEVRESIYDLDSFDFNNLKYGNAFLTKQEAEKELEKRKALAKIKKWIWENNVKTEGLGDIGYKIFVFGNEGLFIDEYANSKAGIGDIIFSNRENAYKCLEECKESWNILFDLE